jgi:hypothetical protein
MKRRFLLAVLFLPLFYVHAFAQTVSEITSIVLERDPGYWGQRGESPCPFYKLTIFADGAVELQPKRYNANGIVSGKIIKSFIAAERVERLVSQFEKINFNTLTSTSENKQNGPEDCPRDLSDDVTTILSITINGKTKRIEHYHGCRGTASATKLTNLENEIDEAVDMKRWFDCSNGKNRVDLSDYFN